MIMEKVIAVHLAEGFEEIEAVSIIDVLRRAGLKVVTVSVTGQPEVKGAHDISITADKLFEEINYSIVEMIVLPGGMPGAKNLKNHSGLNAQILDFNKSGKPLGAICAAPMVFGNLGLLKGKNATCFPGFESELKGANVTGNAVEVADNIITGKGAGVAIQFALKIMEHFKGQKAANELGNRMVVNQ